MSIYKANRIALLDEGSFLGFARALNIVGSNVAATIASADTGLITFTQRELLTANRTYYVRTDGSDSNTGLVNSAGGAFATIQKAVNVTAALDLSTFGVTIQLGNTGSYAGWNVASPFVGGPGSSVLIQGDAAAAGSYVITGTGFVSLGKLFISGVKFVPSSGDGLFIAENGSVTINGAVQFGAASGARQIVMSGKSSVLIGAIVTINGSAANWILAIENSIFTCNGFAPVFSGTPAFSAATVQAQTGASVSIVNGAPSGAATGQRYNVASNAVVFTNGGGATYIPGNVGGGTASGGQYL